MNCRRLPLLQSVTMAFEVSDNVFKAVNTYYECTTLLSTPLLLFAGQWCSDNLFLVDKSDASVWGPGMGLAHGMIGASVGNTDNRSTRARLRSGLAHLSGLLLAVRSWKKIKWPLKVLLAQHTVAGLLFLTCKPKSTSTA